MVKATEAGTTDTFVEMQAKGYLGNYLQGDVGANVYAGTDLEFRVTSRGMAQTGDPIYRDVHANGYIGNYLAAEVGMNAYVGTDLELRVTSRGMATNGDPIYRDIRTATVWSGHIASHTGNMYVGSDDEVRITSRGGYNDGVITYRNLRANAVYTNSININSGTHLYLRASSGGEVRVTEAGATTPYAKFRAGTIYYDTLTASSNADFKKDITDYEGDGLHEIVTTPIREYRLNTDTDTEKKRLGIIVQESPADIVDIQGQGIETYAMITMAWKAIQQLNAKIEELETRIANG
jgi:hypothetical protein